MLRGARTPLALADYAGLVLLNHLFDKAHSLEKEYMDYIANLSSNAAELEENLCLHDVDCSEVISKYAEKLAEQKAAKERAQQRKKKTADEESLAQNRRVTRGTKRKSQEQAVASYIGKKSSASATQTTVAPAVAAKKSADDFEYLLSASAPERYIDAIRNRHKELQLTEGIPPDTDPEEYIKYRKCLYVENISTFRDDLLKLLTPDSVEYLLRLIIRMDVKLSESLERRQPGMFTLKVLLFNKFSRIFSLNTNEFPKTIKKTNPFYMLTPRSIIENRIGPTILRSSLLEGSWLAKLTLEQTCTDSIMECVGRVARNLTYLNITGSSVTDQGLLHLVGVENDSSLSRRHLTRKCKQNLLKTDNLVKDKNPRWIKHKDRGTDKLVFITAMNIGLKWPTKNDPRYYNSNQVPIDCGFIAILDFVPSLKGLNTEVGCRVVAGYSRYQRWARKSARRDLNLETITESKPTSALLECVGSRCPNFKKLIITRQHEFGHTEEWFTGMEHLKGLQHLIASCIDLGTTWFSKSIPNFGHCLTTLHFDTVRVYKYSFIQMVKEQCPNLVKLALLMANKKLAHKQIRVEKDVDLRSLHQGLFNLQELHLIGPLFSEYVRYVVAGATKLKCLTLGIEWPEETCCNVGPESRKDLLGKEYIDELLSVNGLEDVEELHLFAQYRRGSVRLTESFAIYLATQFKNLKHLGSFHLWSREINTNACLQAVSMINPAITFDENYNVQANRTRIIEKPSFSADKFKETSPYSCAWLNINQPTYCFLSEVAELLVGGPAIPWDFAGNVLDDEPDMDSDSDSDDSGELGDMLHPLQNIVNPNDLDSDDEGPNQPVFMNGCNMQ